MKIGNTTIRLADIEYYQVDSTGGGGSYPPRAQLHIRTTSGGQFKVEDVDENTIALLDKALDDTMSGSERVSVTQPKRHAYDPVADLPPDVRAKYEYLPEPKKVTIRINWDAETVSYILEWGNRMVRTGDDLTKLVEQSYEAYWDALVSHAAQTVVQQHPSDKEREIVAQSFPSVGERHRSTFEKEIERSIFAQVLGSQQFEGPDAQRERDIVVIARQVAESMRATISMVTHLGSQVTTSEVKANRDKCAAMVESVVAEVLKALWTGQ